MSQGNEVLMSKVGDASFTRINDHLISDVERLMKILESKHTADETREEINETIQSYMKETRNNRVYVPIDW